jgi:peptidoglycan/LPS O-acetylase OafA/YrhL
LACVNPALALPGRISYAGVTLFLWAQPMLDFFNMFTNPAVIAILAFIVAIFVLNVIEFGRVD